MAKFATHMGDPHGDPQASPQHADPHELLVWFSLKRRQVHVHRRVVDRRVVGWSMWITHMGGKFPHGLLEKSLQNPRPRINGDEGGGPAEPGGRGQSCPPRTMRIPRPPPRTAGIPRPPPPYLQVSVGIPQPRPPCFPGPPRLC